MSDWFLLSFADEFAIWTYNFVSLIVKKMLSGLVFVLSAAADKTQYFVH